MLDIVEATVLGRTAPAMCWRCAHGHNHEHNAPSEVRRQLLHRAYRPLSSKKIPI
jgi:hypothetical protein